MTPAFYISHTAQPIKNAQILADFPSQRHSSESILHTQSEWWCAWRGLSQSSIMSLALRVEKLAIGVSSDCVLRGVARRPPRQNIVLISAASLSLRSPIDAAREWDSKLLCCVWRVSDRRAASSSRSHQDGDGEIQWLWHGFEGRAEVLMAVLRFVMLH